MKFNYKYRTSDNVQHEGIVRAPDRDAAFARLRAIGIKPSKVEEAPGVWNKLLGKGKRWIAIAFLSVMLAALGVAYFVGDVNVSGDADSRGRYGDTNVILGSVYATKDGLAIPIGRRQIWGDATVVDNAASRGWSGLFTNECDRLLAKFAIPGRKVARVFFPSNKEGSFFEPALTSDIVIDENELEEFKQMKCMVAGMREELRIYLDDGGSPESYVERLNERQAAEIAAIAQKKRVLDVAISLKRPDLMEVWNKVNRELRDMGLPIFPQPADVAK